MATDQKHTANEDTFTLHDQATPPAIGGHKPRTHETSPFVDSEGNFIERPAAEQRRLMRRIDWHLVPLVALLYWLASLDRGDLGKARLFGLEKDLHMAGRDFNVAALMLSVTHILFEIPSNLILKKVKPSIWLPCIALFCGFLIAVLTLGWGLATMASGWSQNLADLVVCRLFIGFFQAGLFPGCIYLISMWYKRGESTPHADYKVTNLVQKRITLFFGISALAGSFSG